MEEVDYMQVISTELPKDVVIKIAKKLNDNISDRGFIWVKKIKNNVIAVNVEDGFGNMFEKSVTYKVEGNFTLEESYDFKVDGKRVFVGYDEDTVCEVNTIWKNNKHRLSNPLTELRDKYSSGGKYTGDERWLKRLEKLDRLSTVLAEKNLIKSYKRNNFEVVINYGKTTFVFGVNYGVVISNTDNISREFFELVSHKDTIIAVKDKVKKANLPDFFIDLIKCYDLR